MTRKAKCSNCGRWFYNDNGLYISRPPEYDSSMCPTCNADIDNQITNDSNKIRFYGKLD